MAELEAGLYALLAADGTVSGLIGTRIYPAVIPQNIDLPAIAYQLIGAPDRYYAHDGAVGLARKRIQISSVADTYAAMKSLAVAVRGALSGYQGTTAAVKIHSSFLVNEFDSFGAENDINVNRQDYMIIYTEA